ncbi:alkaline phosphatase D family protein [Vibrio sp. TRT 17S01]|uniref:alkaline phosphatase D family protein n=1 Tax=Vibrio sp. TRT 17S01 TaxID=3418505 RepID=UPI003CE8815D
MTTDSSLPLFLAGPILRKATTTELVFWGVTSEPIDGAFHLYLEPDMGEVFCQELSSSEPFQVGKKAYLYLWQFHGHFPEYTALSYEFVTQRGPLSALIPSLCYQEENRPTFVISSKADYILHGSCRNPHHSSPDALAAADKKVAQQPLEQRPDLLMMSGDQIYADHVALPMLDAIQQVIALLGLPEEAFTQAPIENSQALYQHKHNYAGREQLLPHYVDEDGLLAKLLPKRGIPIFSSRDCENHLITFAEFFAMYLLNWSPELWNYIQRERLLEQQFTHAERTLSPKWQQQWREEKVNIDQFVEDLPNVRRLMAHIPTYMIFDDHDITDDWNLTVGWEKAAYTNPFSKRIIGNGLIAYWLCQGWGNEPAHFPDELKDLTARYLKVPEPQHQDELIQYLFTFERWHYTIQTTPKVVVLDTRTRRWRSESRMNKPSGLMDWEALIEFQQELMHQDKVIVVSAAPMFGVKFIEALQRGMTWLGYPLLIDAENWMAHPGSANTLISIFTHTKTPTNFVILSGDVHYSFAYDIKLRFRGNSPNIYQITCSGFKNQFPEPLLTLCDFMDRWLYSPRSPLNFFTKRKRLKIYKRDPDSPGHKRLVNSSAIGELTLDAQGKPKQISILTGHGETIEFMPIKRIE